MMPSPVITNGAPSASLPPLLCDSSKEDKADEDHWANFEQFCSCTSLHGWKYLSRKVNMTLRLGWVAVVLASMGVASFFLGYSLNDFLSSTVQTTQDTSR